MMDATEMAQRILALEGQVKALEHAQPYRYICRACGAHLKEHDMQVHSCPMTGKPTFRLM